jgi:Family of unknown function (DUF6166)
MKVYSGTRTIDGPVVMIQEDGHCRALDPRRDLHDYNSSGFDWGREESGPAQLALALAADVLGDDERALEVHKPLKYTLISRLCDHSWVLTESRIRSAIKAIDKVLHRGQH